MRKNTGILKSACLIVVAAALYLNSSAQDIIKCPDGTARRKVLHQPYHLKLKPDNNDRLLNTYSFDFGGLASLTISQSYERRTRDGKIGFRIPFYLSFTGNIDPAGVTNMIPHEGGLFDYAPMSDDIINYSGPYSYQFAGAGFATGLNVKFYFYSQKKYSLFAGPEVTLGVSFSKLSEWEAVNNTQPSFLAYTYTYNYFTLACLGKFGISFDCTRRFNLTIDGGLGFASVNGAAYAYGFAPVWQFGLALGGNF